MSTRLEWRNSVAANCRISPDSLPRNYKLRRADFRCRTPLDAYL